VNARAGLRDRGAALLVVTADMGVGAMCLLQFASANGLLFQKVPRMRPLFSTSCFKQTFENIDFFFCLIACSLWKTDTYYIFWFYYFFPIFPKGLFPYISCSFPGWINKVEENHAVRSRTTRTERKQLYSSMYWLDLSQFNRFFYLSVKP